MLSEQVLFALNDADDMELERARSSLGYGTKKVRARRRQVLRTLLIAAAISVLFATTAFAAGWFGLGSLRAGQLFGVDVISLEGLWNSPEGKALSEWLSFYEQHRGDAFDPEEAFALSEDYEGYGVTTREMADKVDELCEKYGLRRLGSVRVPEDEKTYYRAAGVGKLTAGTGEIENDFLSGYVYEDGTFQFDGKLYCSDRAYPIPYSFRSSAKGTLGYVAMNVGVPDSFEEWDYTAGGGTVLHLANNDALSLMLLDTGDSFVVLTFGHSSHADYYGDGIIDGVGDEPVSFTLSREELEALAGAFRWEALRDPEAGMDEPFTRHRFAAPAQPALPEDVDFSAAEAQDRYYLGLACEEQIAPYIRDFRLVDYRLDIWGSETTGWIAFTGTPKTALSWARVPSGEGTLFCRSLSLTAGGPEGSWLAGEAFDMLPYEPLRDSRDIGTDGEHDYIYLGTDLPEITAASLYVQQTGETYTLTEADALSRLQKLLRFNRVPAPPEKDGWNPLYLSLADGRSALVYTAADGSDSVCMFGQWQRYEWGVDLFSLFDVPLSAAGYSRTGDVLTARTEGRDDRMAQWVEVDYQADGPALERRVMSDMLRAARYEYDDAGNLTRESQWEGDTMTMETVCRYTGDGRLLHSESRWGSFWETEDYAYDDRGRLTAIIVHDSDDLPGAAGGNTYYSYDAQGNCRISRG